MLQSRRQFLSVLAGLAGIRSGIRPGIQSGARSRIWAWTGAGVMMAGGDKVVAMSDGAWRFPDEGEPHKRTWMAFVASDAIWHPRQIPAVQQDLARIARTIARHEPVAILVADADRETAVELLGGLDSHAYPIELFSFATNDLWMRDTGPAFVLDAQGELAALELNFNGWGEDQDYALDAGVAGFIAEQTGVRTLSSPLTLEGGCFEVDGHGTAIMTESCILNDNRNPGRSKAFVEQSLKAALGLEQIIWLKGIKGRDITDGHTDFFARFAGPGTVVVSGDTDTSSYDYRVTRQNISLLEQARDARGEALELVVLDTPWAINTRYGSADFAAGYVGYYLCNGALIMQKFGDRAADSAARRKLAQLFPDRQIEQIAIDGIASGGGSIHCATQQEPVAGSNSYRLGGSFRE